MLVVADPIFSANDSRLTLAESDVNEQTINLMGAIADWKQMGVKGIREREEEQDVSVVAEELFPRLEKTEVLASEMETMFGERTAVLSGTNAGEEDIVGSDLSSYKYLTFMSILAV